MAGSNSEATNRAAKAGRLIEVIDRVLAASGIRGSGAEQAAAVSRMPDSWWADVAGLSHDNPPSVETRKVVVNVIARRDLNDDPFASFQLDQAGAR